MRLWLWLMFTVWIAWMVRLLWWNRIWYLKCSMVGFLLFIVFTWWLLLDRRIKFLNYAGWTGGWNVRLNRECLLILVDTTLKLNTLLALDWFLGIRVGYGRLVTIVWWVNLRRYLRWGPLVMHVICSLLVACRRLTMLVGRCRRANLSLGDGTRRWLGLMGFVSLVVLWWGNRAMGRRTLLLRMSRVLMPTLRLLMLMDIRLVRWTMRGLLLRAWWNRNMILRYFLMLLNL